MASMDIDFTRRNKKPRMLTEAEKDRLEEFIESIHYSSRLVHTIDLSCFRNRRSCRLVRPMLPQSTLFGVSFYLRTRSADINAYRYNDDHFEYRHVQLPKQMLKVIPKDYFDGARGTLKLLWEDEWRGLGITQSLGWEHYEVHEPEPHILLFK